MSVDINTLKYTFYRELYIDYKAFIDIQSGSRDKDHFFTDVYTQTLKKAPYKVFDKGGKENNLNKLTPDLKDEKRVCASVENFFEIIEDNDESKDYVWALMRFMKNATTRTEGGWLMVEDYINRLILKYFWNKYCQDGNMREDEKLQFTIYNPDTRMDEKKELSYSEYCRVIEKKKDYESIRIMVSLARKLGKTPQNIDYFERHLNKSRDVRNKVAHQKLLPESTADAVVIARYKLYSYLATVLVLQPTNVEIGTKLVLQDMTEKQDARFNVWELDSSNGNIPVTPVTLEKGKFGWECSIWRFHSYRIEVSNTNKELCPNSFSLSPSGTWNGSDLQLYNDMNEQVANQPAGSLSTLQRVSEDMAQSLANIDNILTRGINNQKEQLNQAIEILLSLQKTFTESTERQTEANEKTQQQLTGINNNLTQMSQELRVMTLSIVEGNSRSAQESAQLIKQFLATVGPILDEIGKMQEEQRFKEKKTLFVKRIPLWIALGAAAYGCLMHCIALRTIYWMTLKPWYIGSIVLGPLILAGWVLGVYFTTRKKELITSRVKIIDWGAIGLTTLLWGTAIAVTPHPTEEEYIQNFGWDSNDVAREKFINFVNTYLVAHPESEVARVKLGEYYLNIANDLEQAAIVTAPMNDVKKYPNGCAWAAEALYYRHRNGDLLEVKDIIEDYMTNYPNHIALGLKRLYALLLIDGSVYDSPDPDQGLAILHELAERGDYPQACYDLGHWSATDLAEWKPGTQDVVTLRYDLPTAVKYLRKVAGSMPKAALELGDLYADLGVVDSAQHYLGLAAKQANGELQSKALFHLGLLLEHQAQTNNTPMREALLRDYAPAVEHKALLEKDHRTAIERMRRAGPYQGLRTIPPIVFEYLKAKEIRNFTGLRDSALKILQEQRPECRFNSTFISAMEAVLGTSRMKKDLDSAWVLLRQSSEEGCLYAKMMCCYQDALSDLENGSKSISIKPLNEILPVIPFAGVLLSDLYISTGHYGQAIEVAQYPIAKNSPAAAFILSSIPPSYNIRTDKEVLSNRLNGTGKELYYSYLIQKIVRLSPHKNRWLMECYNCDTAKRNMFRDYPDSSQVSMMWQHLHTYTPSAPSRDSYFADNKEGARLWIDVISSSNNLRAKLNAALWASTDTLQREQLVSSALRDLQRNENSPKELWDMWLWCLGFCHLDFQMDLRNKGSEKYKKMYDNWVELMIAGKPSSPKFLPDIEHLTLGKHILINEQLDELTSIIEEFRLKCLSQPSTNETTYETNLP